MKKVILGFAAFAGIATAANAQIKIAPEVGVNLSTMQIKSNTLGTYTSGRATSFKAGVMVEFPIASGFSIEPGIMYSSKGGKNINAISPLNSTLSGETMLSYLEIPVNLKYAYNLGTPGKIFVHAGPYLGYALGGKYSPKTGNSSTFKFGKNIDQLNPLDIGLNFGLGYQIPMGLYFRAQYGLGLTDINNISTDNFKTTNNSNIGLSVGFQF